MPRDLAKVLVLRQMAVTLLVAIGLWTVAPPQHALSFFIGSAFVMINWVLLTLSWSWVLGKKSIALATSTIVIKYAIFGIICVVIVRLPWVSLGWLVGGISMIIPTVLWLALRPLSGEKENNS